MKGELGSFRGFGLPFVLIPGRFRVDTAIYLDAKACNPNKQPRRLSCCVPPRSLSLSLCLSVSLSLSHSLWVGEPVSPSPTPLGCSGDSMLGSCFEVFTVFVTSSSFPFA